MSEPATIFEVWRGACPGCRRDQCIIGFLPHGPLEAELAEGVVAFLGDQVVEVIGCKGEAFVVQTPAGTQEVTELQWAMPVAVHPKPHCMYFVATDISEYATAAKRPNAHRWATPEYAIELSSERLLLVDSDGDRVVFELDGGERRALGMALRGFRRRPPTPITIAPSGVCEVTLMAARAHLSALVDPTGQATDILERQGPQAFFAVLNGLAAKDGAKKGFPAGIQAADLTVPRAVARQLSMALLQPVELPN